ncbi:glycosyltransferase family 4 protein [Cellulomonas fimi]|uniref:Glycosyltransferase family 4 protein n=1 Tax=Cellulomonas fimi TaxID=1708 RepID=A0A7Y0QIP0_CELFI|nr:glycosyltransferase family 4 protein [Cellulomonas fimi]NMR21438.1 glycosyltransferase family 4 protein [Cellulomonas fimi]
MTAGDRLVLVHLNSLELGGTQIIALDLAEAIAPLGFRSHLIGPAPASKGPTLLDVARDRALTVHPYREPSTVLAHARVLARRADEIGADVVHAYGTWGAARAAYWGPCRLGRRPWVLTMYEMALHPSVHRHMPMIVGTEYLHEECGDRPGPTVLMSPPVDLIRNRPAEAVSPSAGVTVVIVSRLEEDMKSVPVEAAIGAVGRLGEYDVTLEIVGSGKAEPRLRTLGEKTNADLGRAAVRFLGAMADPRSAYANADIVLGMGSSAARGLAHGKPLVVQGENGWSVVFEPDNAATLARNSYWSPERVDDPDALLAQHLRGLIEEAPRRRRLGAFGRAFAEERFGLTEMAERLASVYELAAVSYTAGSWLADLPVEASRVPAKLARLAGVRHQL